jgi:DNA-binding transcriptional LysR family regulator
MRKAPVDRIDFKLLVLFDEIYRTRSVTRSAESLGQSQPTMSIWLAKLRAHFGDTLFVRTSAGMAPTPRADELVRSIRAALDMLHQISGPPVEFTPATSHRRFCICTMDSSHVVLLPRLLAHVHASAPNVRIDIDHISPQTAKALESGEADLAVGFIPWLEAGFYQQTLFSQGFGCLARAGHPRVRRGLTLKQYKEEAHVVVIPTGTGHGIVDRALERQRIERRILLQLPSYLGLATILATTDFIATVPRQIGEALAQSGAIRLYDCPVRIASYQVKQHWHERYHRDLGNQWLRGVFSELFGDGSQNALRK